MVKIRLARYGKKKQPSYRLVVSDARKDTLGTYIENLGSYNPTVIPKQITIKADRVKYWLSVGAQSSPTVHNLLISEGIIEGKKVKASRHKAKTKDENANTQANDQTPSQDETAPETPVKNSSEEPIEAKTDTKEEIKPQPKADEPPAQEEPNEKVEPENKEKSKPEDTKAE